MIGKTVKIYLADGIPNGLMTAEIMNWTGKFVVTPRSQLPDLAARQELRRTGVYFLAGSNPEDPSQEMVYIGESDQIWNRLKQHNLDNHNEFWEKTVIVISKDENLTKSHVRYLESRLIQIAYQAGRAKILNGTNPETTNLPEPDIADMENFLEQILLVLPVLGFTFTNSIPTINRLTNTETQNETSPIFTFSYAGVKAKAQQVNNEFIVFKNSLARKTHTNSLADSYIHLRENLVSSGSLIDSDDNNFWILTRDISFQSPSTAANIVGGASLNGRTHWKMEGTGKTFAKWSEEQVEAIDNNIL